MHVVDVTAAVAVVDVGVASQMQMEQIVRQQMSQRMNLKIPAKNPQMAQPTAVAAAVAQQAKVSPLVRSLMRMA